MTKNELIELFRRDMLNSLRLRDNTSPDSYSEEFGYFNGQYRAYETVIEVLYLMRISEIGEGDSRNMKL